MIVRFFDWDQPRNVTCSNKSITDGKVVVEHEWGNFIADVLMPNKNIEGEEFVGKVKRRVLKQDEKAETKQSKKEKEIFKEAKGQAREMSLPMKIIDARVSIDGSCAVIAFVADGRVDFRSLVRNLSAKHGKSIRLQQIGSRDEARRCGGYGICGRELCCTKFSGGLKSISTEMARCQLISHRGSDRISGLCGRLMCCLAYEADQYEELIKKLPKRGEEITVDGKKGRVLDVLVSAQKVKVEFADGEIELISQDKLEKEKREVK